MEGMHAVAAMASADLRRDRLTGTTTLVVAPWTTAKAADPSPLGLEMPSGSNPCPFCPEQLDDASLRADDVTASVAGAGHRPWAAVAMRNRWPHTLDSSAAEVVVLSRDHESHLATMHHDDAVLALGLLVKRAEAQRARGCHPLVFVNYGVNAGASQPHPHGQVIGLPAPDPLSAAEAPALVRGSCVLCEPVGGARLVARLPGVAVVTPEAPVVDYDQVVLLEGHAMLDLDALARGVVAALRALWSVTGPVAYNLVFHLDGHAHVHVTPRTVRHSAYGLAGIQICYVEPAQATARLAAAAQARADDVRSSAA